MNEVITEEFLRVRRVPYSMPNRPQGWTELAKETPGFRSYLAPTTATLFTFTTIYDCTRFRCRSKTLNQCEQVWLDNKSNGVSNSGVSRIVVLQ